jgi:hypothetical protein
MSLLIKGNPAFQAIEHALRSIGYRDELLERKYAYTDVVTDDQAVRPIHTIDLAAFAQKPYTYRNACIGVVVSTGHSGPDNVSPHTALGAPLIFEIDGAMVNRWKITPKGASEFKERFPVASIETAFVANKSFWEPDTILRAKAIGGSPGPYQLDFFDVRLMPFLEGRNFYKLDYLLREIITNTTNIYRRLTRRRPNFKELFPLAFRFIAAKIFRERGYAGGWASNDARVALQAIERHYNVGTEQLPPSAIHESDLLNAIWSMVLSLFRFPNFAEDDLALLFEKTFITPQTRKELGVHSTPPTVVEYIVHKLPFHELPVDSRHVLEPFAGHGRFLISAMKRLKALLPSGTSEAERHKYLVDRLVGIEVDPFSIEVCRLSLMMADEPNPNGWRLYPEDVFASGRLEAELRPANVVLCNPPFEDFTPQERSTYNMPGLLARRPAEVLRRLFTDPPELLGLVLPSLFITSSSYKPFHKQLAERYGSIDLVALPPVFNYSEATTVLISAFERRQRAGPVTVTSRRVTEGANCEAFLRYGIVPSAVDTVFQPTNFESPQFSLWIPPLSRVWNYCQDYPRLEGEVEIHQGIKWIAASDRRGQKLDKYISTTPRPGYARGYARAEGILSQYSLEPQEWYLSLRPVDQYDNAYKYDWHQPKVVCNAARRQRSPWRVAAVADAQGLAFSQRFMAFWPKRISIYALAALLNSPICNAFLFATEGERSPNHKRTFKQLPIPFDLSAFGKGSAIDLLSKELHKRTFWRDDEKVRDTLLKADAAILAAYDLPPKVERELLDTFQGEERPVPGRFNGYYPDDLEAYIPLHELISPEFENARADRLLERLVPVDDPEISKALAQLQ